MALGETKNFYGKIPYKKRLQLLQAREYVRLAKILFSADPDAPLNDFSSNTGKDFRSCLV